MILITDRAQFSVLLTPNSRVPVRPEHRYCHCIVYRRVSCIERQLCRPASLVRGCQSYDLKCNWQVKLEISTQSTNDIDNILIIDIYIYTLYQVP